MKAMKKVKKEDLVIKKEIISILSEREIEQVRGGGTTDDGDNESENEYSCTTRCLCLSKRNNCNRTDEPILQPYTTTAEEFKPYTYGPGCKPATIDPCLISAGCNYEGSVNVCLVPTVTGQNCNLNNHL